jgi:hypothetical protein
MRGEPDRYGCFSASQRLDQWEAYNASFLVGLRCSSTPTKV